MNQMAVPVLAALVLCATIPAAAQAPACSSLPMKLEVLVEAAGQTEEDALRALDGKTATALEVLDTPCARAGGPYTELHTDGSWSAGLSVYVPGHEGDLRDLAGSLGGAATPVSLSGWHTGPFIAGFAVLFAVVGVTVWYDRTKGKEDILGFGIFMGMWWGAITFVATHSTSTYWV